MDNSSIAFSRAPSLPLQALTTLQQFFYILFAQIFRQRAAQFRRVDRAARSRPCGGARPQKTEKLPQRIPTDAPRLRARRRSCPAIADSFAAHPRSRWPNPFFVARDSVRHPANRVDTQLRVLAAALRSSASIMSRKESISAAVLKTDILRGLACFSHFPPRARSCWRRRAASFSFAGSNPAIYARRRRARPRRRRCNRE